MKQLISFVFFALISAIVLCYDIESEETSTTLDPEHVHSLLVLDLYVAKIRRQTNENPRNLHSIPYLLVVVPILKKMLRAVSKNKYEGARKHRTEEDQRFYSVLEKNLKDLITMHRQNVPRNK